MGTGAVLFGTIRAARPWRQVLEILEPDVSPAQSTQTSKRFVVMRHRPGTGGGGSVAEGPPCRVRGRARRGPRQRASPAGIQRGNDVRGSGPRAQGIRSRGRHRPRPAAARRPSSWSIPRPAKRGFSTDLPTARSGLWATTWRSSFKSNNRRPAGPFLVSNAPATKATTSCHSCPAPFSEAQFDPVPDFPPSYRGAAASAESSKSKTFGPLAVTSTDSGVVAE